MTDIVERLRAGLPMHKRVLDASLIREAADEIERLRDELEAEKVRSIAKPSSLESEIASELGLKGPCTCQ